MSNEEDEGIVINLVSLYCNLLDPDDVKFIKKVKSRYSDKYCFHHGISHNLVAESLESLEIQMHLGPRVTDDRKERLIIHNFNPMHHGYILESIRSML